MADYLTKTGLKNSIDNTVMLQLLDDTQNAVDLDDATVTANMDKGIDIVTAKVNSYIQKQYDISSLDPTVSMILEYLALACFKYWLWGRRGKIPSDVTDEYNSAISQLEKIATGESVIGSSEIEDVSNTIELASETDSPRIYTTEELDSLLG